MVISSDASISISQSSFFVDMCPSSGKEVDNIIANICSQVNKIFSTNSVMKFKYENTLFRFCQRGEKALFCVIHNGYLSNFWDFKEKDVHISSSLINLI